MTRLKSILCASLLTLALSASAFAGDISGRSSNLVGDISGRSASIAGDISGRSASIAGDISGRSIVGDISGLVGSVFGIGAMLF